MAVQGLISNRLRSLLTMLGITIGVASVIVLVAVGHGSAVEVDCNYWTNQGGHLIVAVRYALPSDFNPFSDFFVGCSSRHYTVRQCSYGNATDHAAEKRAPTDDTGVMQERIATPSM